MNERATQPRPPKWIALALAALALVGGRAAWAAEPVRPAGNHQTIDLVNATYAAEPGSTRLPSADPNAVPAVDCVNHCPPGYKANWNALGPVPEFQQYGHGEYVGRARLPHVPVYRLRVDDEIDFEFRVDHERIAGQYKLNVGDTVLLASTTQKELNRAVLVLPDGTITVPHVGGVSASGLTAMELQHNLGEALKKYVNDPAVSVLPTKVNTKLEELRSTVAGNIGFARQILPTKVTPEGTVQLPAIGIVPAQGLTLEEFKAELDERFSDEIDGMEVIPALKQHGPRYVYVLGEVAAPGRYTLEAPTTVMQALSMAGSWTVGAHIDNIVVFRRGDDWRLMATKLNLTRALLGKDACPEGEIWVSDCDLIIVPKSKLLRTDNFIELVFTRGLYGVVPVQFAVTLDPFKGVLPWLPF